MGIAENIKRLREQKGLTQDELGGRLGVTGTTVYGWEPTPATRAKASFVVDNGNVLLDENAEWKAWAIAYRKMTGYTVAEARVEDLRGQLLTDVDRFVRSLS